MRSVSTENLPTRRPARKRVLACLCLLCLLSLMSACSGSLARLPQQKFEQQSLVALDRKPTFVTENRLPPADAEAADADADRATHVDVPASRVSIAPPTGMTWADASAQSADAGSVNRADWPIDVNAVNAPLDALLHALATDAGVELHPVGQLEDRVTLRLQQSSLSATLAHLAAQAGFAWELAGSRLTVWNGDAYAFSYPVDYLNLDRRTESSVGLATQVGTINASVQGAGSIANSSQTRVENTSEHHFWTSLQQDVAQLLTHARAVTRVSSPTRPGVPAEQARAPFGVPDAPSQARFTINREAGLLSLFAVPAIHQSVQAYLAKLHDSARRQVLIEATVVEVALSDSFASGVDWQVLASGVNGISAVQSLLGVPLVKRDSVDRIVTPSGLVSLVQRGRHGDVRATLSLLEQFGDVRILSRPRIIALNNQSSVLKVVDNRVYFTVNIERRQSETRDEVVTESEIHTVPVGLVMNVTPQISSSGAVMLNVRPTLSRILGFVNDPNPELAEANVRNGVPEIQVREMESMLQVHSGDIAIIGGLMQETSEQNDSQLPGLGRLPVFKHLFSQRARKRRQTELLIVLRPTVIDSNERLVAQQ